MAEFTIAEARNLGLFESQVQATSAPEILRKAAVAVGRYDIFLSHSFRDATLILGVRAILERSGKRVYVDWIDDPQLDRSRVTSQTAAKLRLRMDDCDSLVYAATPSATTSKWMPWELGYFDGRKGPEAVAILPLVNRVGESIGQEYLELYPKVERSAVSMLPVVTQRRDGATIKKSIDDLVKGRGGAAWGSVF